MDSKIDAISDNWIKAVAIKPPSPEPAKEKELQGTSVLLIRRRKSIPTKLMVDAAIKSHMTTSRSSVSLIAIKRYIAQNYQAANVEVNNRLKHIKRYIMSSLDNGKLIRTKGVGVSGSFRLPSLKKKVEKNQKPKKKRGRKTKAQMLKGMRGARTNGGGKLLLNLPVARRLSRKKK